jgi:hypothetical protein
MKTAAVTTRRKSYDGKNLENGGAFGFVFCDYRIRPG